MFGAVESRGSACHAAVIHVVVEWVSRALINYGMCICICHVWTTVVGLGNVGTTSPEVRYLCHYSTWLCRSATVTPANQSSSCRCSPSTHTNLHCTLCYWYVLSVILLQWCDTVSVCCVTMCRISQKQYMMDRKFQWNTNRNLHSLYSVMWFDWSWVTWVRTLCSLFATAESFAKLAVIISCHVTLAAGFLNFCTKMTNILVRHDYYLDVIYSQLLKQFSVLAGQQLDVDFHALTTLLV